MAACTLYVTAENRDAALSIARALIDERLAACVNVLGDMTSVFHWQGAVEEATEAAFLVKTTDDLAPRTMARIVELHDYDCPCVVKWPISGGHAPFIDWIGAETSAAKD